MPIRKLVLFMRSGDFQCVLEEANVGMDSGPSEVSAVGSLIKTCADKLSISISLGEENIGSKNPTFRIMVVPAPQGKHDSWYNAHLLGHESEIGAGKSVPCAIGDLAFRYRGLLGIEITRDNPSYDTGRRREPSFK